MPVTDVAGRIREAAFALLVRDGEPVTTSALAGAIGLPPEAVSRVVVTLAGAGWLDLDESGRVSGAAGLSLEASPHRLSLDGSRFHTWCAFDALGIPAALAASGELSTPCGVCGRPLQVTFAAGEPDRAGPELLWLAEGGTDLRAAFCTPTVLLCGREHGQEWANIHDGHGDLLDLKVGSERGAIGWAGCAAALRMLA